MVICFFFHDEFFFVFFLKITYAFTGAIKFGDRLTHKQCTQLVRALAECDVPFQCAHGRPSITPLLDIGELARLYNDIEARPRYGRLMQMI